MHKTCSKQNKKPAGEIFGKQGHFEISYTFWKYFLHVQEESENFLFLWEYFYGMVHEGIL